MEIYIFNLSVFYIKFASLLLIRRMKEFKNAFFDLLAERLWLQRNSLI